MSMQELWKIKENLGEKFWGKSADEINAMIKPNVEVLRRKIEQLRREFAHSATPNLMIVKEKGNEYGKKTRGRKRAKPR